MMEINNPETTKDIIDYDPTNRFSTRVSDYIKYRPSYPEDVFKSVILSKIGVNENYTIADIGSGTGIFTNLLLSNTKQNLSMQLNQTKKCAKLQRSY